MNGQQSLNREQKEAIGLLSVGTFLEYFDLMLYIHMAVLLNELFFPKTDPFVASLLTAFAFCSTYVFRPLGALIFGWIGDNFGRKATVILTTFIMACCCLVMVVLPTYAEIGILASCGMILCRAIQGMAAMGEAVGAELYLTEITKPPIQYPTVALISIFCGIGSTLALGFASFVTGFGLNWRYAFLAGTVIVLIGGVARTKLRETRDFADAKRRLKEVVRLSKEDPKILEDSAIWQEKVNKLTAFSLFLIQCGLPVAFYFVYIHSGTILKNSFNFTAEQVIHQSFIISSAHLVTRLIIAYLSYRVYPLTILKVKLVLFTAVILLCPYLLNNITSSFQLLLIQIWLITFAPTDFPAAAIFYKHFPIFKRYTYGCMMYALGRTVMYIVTSFGLVYLIKYFGNWGILVIAVPIICGYKFALTHFENLDKENRGDFQKKNFPAQEQLDFAG
jgi:MHS family proline/betaine transporter-like MFS transporter